MVKHYVPSYPVTIPEDDPNSTVDPTCKILMENFDMYDED